MAWRGCSGGISSVLTHWTPYNLFPLLSDVCSCDLSCKLMDPPNHYANELYWLLDSSCDFKRNNLVELRLIWSEKKRENWGFGNIRWTVTWLQFLSWFMNTFCCDSLLIFAWTIKHIDVQIWSIEPAEIYKIWSLIYHCSSRELINWIQWSDMHEGRSKTTMFSLGDT